MSDILIKNMELPKKGHYLFQISANGDVWVSNRNDEGTGIIIAKAIELPPHGRLGDLDKVADDISSRSEKARINEDADIADGFMYSAMIVRNAPTIVEASGC